MANPCSEMFGGGREKVEVGVSIGIQESAEALVRTVESYLANGYRRVKIKIKPGREVDRDGRRPQQISRPAPAGGREFGLHVGECHRVQADR